MSSTLNYAILPGGLSEADRERIFDLADRGMKCGPIARRIQKHPCTVRWFMYRNGLVQPTSGRSSMPTDRPNARGAKGYTPVEDAYLLALRTDGLGPTEIARRMTERFGHRRTLHGVMVRLTMLAAREDEPARCLS